MRIGKICLYFKLIWNYWILAHQLALVQTVAYGNILALSFVEKQVNLLVQYIQCLGVGREEDQLHHARFHCVRSLSTDNE